MKVIEIGTEEIKQIVEIALDREVSDFAMDAHFYETYDMDSLGAVALVVEVQKRCDIRIPDERMPEVVSGEKLKAIMEELLRAKASAGTAA